MDILIEQSGSPDTWLEDIKDALQNWKRVKQTNNVQNALKLINYIVSLGLCEASGLTFKVGKLTLFEPIVTKQQIQCADLCDVLFTTVIGFVEGGWMVYKTGEVSAFFSSEDDVAEFEKGYNRIRDIHGFSLTGNLKEHADIGETDYEVLLDSVIEQGSKVVKKISKTLTVEKKYFLDRLDRLRDWRNEFIQVRTRGGLRKAPFAISLFGNTSVGKSTLCQLTIEAVGMYNGFDISPERVATWGDNDKYASNIRSSTNVIIFDDFANTVSTFMDFSPCYRLIQTINNALFLAPMAEAFMKGKVALHPWLVMVTTNVESLMAHSYSEKPESILRRLYHVSVDVKPEFQTDGKLDSEKVRERFGLRKDPDIWLIGVRTCLVGAPQHPGSPLNKYELVPLIYKDKVMKDIGVSEYLEWVQVASKRHYEFQAEIVETMMQPPSNKCQTCGFCFCSCPPCVETNDVPPPVVDDAIFPGEEARSQGDTNYLRTLRNFVMGTSEELEEQSGVITRVLRILLIYAVSFTFSFVVNICITLLSLSPTARSNVYNYYKSGLLNYFTRIYRDAYRTSMRNLYYFARWQQQQRWNLRAMWWHARHVDLSHLVELDAWYDSWIFDWIAWVPAYIVERPMFVWTVIYFRRHNYVDRYWKILCLYLWCFAVSYAWIVRGYYINGIISFYVTCSIIAILYHWERQAVRNELLRRSNTAPAFIQFARSRAGIALLGSAFALYYIVKYVRRMKDVLYPQGNLSPTSMADVAARDAEPDMWATPFISALPMSTASKTTTSADLAALCASSVVYVESEKHFVRGFLVESNFMILPTHFVLKHFEKAPEFTVQCRSRSPKVTGGYFRDTISREYAVGIPNTDFTLVWVPSAGSRKCMTRFLPLDKPCSAEGIFVYKSKEGDCEMFRTLFSSRKVSHRTCANFQGGVYTLPVETQDGMCMSPIVSVGRGSTILGFHLCGFGVKGGAGYLSQDMVRSAISEMCSKPGVVRLCSEGDMPEEQYGTKLVESTDIHHKSPVRYLTPNTSIEVYGSMSVRSTPRSIVVPTLISPHVSEVCGVPQKWGPPKLKGDNVYPYQVALEQLAHPSLSLGGVVSRAVESYMVQFDEIFTRLPELMDARPLNQVETVSGLKGKRFIDPMNFSTSPGWPLSGKKRDYLVLCDPEEFPDVGYPQSFSEEIWDEVDRTCEILRKGERCYFVWKACLKDEPTKLTSEKVRVFQSAPLALQLLIRMYFLPLVRIMQLNPLLTECMVGANAEGPEWGQLNEHMISKGNNILAGDYSKYDQRMPAQLTIAAFDVLISVAKQCDYRPEDITLMESIVSEIVYPLMAYNGDLLMIFGSNPSGQNLTVIINSIVNSLLLRCAYYTIYPEDSVQDFYQNCAFGTYGDDVKGSVSPNRPLFNHISFATYLAQYDIKFTMPDKESVATEYMTPDEADFLKRSDVYNEDLDAHIGVLDESSIFKRLHAHLLSKELTLPQQSAQNIDSSLHDWFYYGREKYNLRREEMLRVAKAADIEHLCQGFDISYDMRVAKWRYKYLGEGIPDENTIFD
jgi:hypothetical protein